MTVIAGIGARSTPRLVREQLTELGGLCRRLGIWVRSGHAPGADYAWERGAREKTLVYLPSTSFNRVARLMTPHVVCLTQPVKGPRPYHEPHAGAVRRAHQSIKDHHPSGGARGPGGLSDKARPFHLRNYFQVMGAAAEEDPVAAVVFWAPEDPVGGVEGGTGQAVRIARSAGIPAWNLARLGRREIVERLRSMTPTASSSL